MAKNKSTAIAVPKRLDRIAKKAASIITQKAKQSELAHDIVISARQAVEISGYILEITADSITMRHKKGHGSSKQVVSTFNNSQIVSRIGEVGDIGLVLAIVHAPVQVITGQTVKVKDGVIVATDIQTGEVTHVRTDIAGFDVQAVVDEAVAARKYGTPVAVKKKKTDGEKPSAKGDKKLVKKGKKKSDESF